MVSDPSYDRRRFLVLGGMAAVAAACSSGDDGDRSAVDAAPSTPTSTAATPAAAATSPAPVDAGATVDPDAAEPDATAADASLVAFGASDFEGVGVCAVLAESAAGPFPTIARLDRRDVTEGVPGHPLRLGLRVIDEACVPVAGAGVEIWHADATGDYSSYTDGGTGKDEGEGTTFLRGFQTAGADGIAEFHTIYPGWYPGRTVHIHVRVHVDGGLVMTSQLYFDDDYTEQVLASPPYAEFGRPDTSTARDPIAAPAVATGGLLGLAAGPTSAGDGTVALANLGVRV